MITVADTTAPSLSLDVTPGLLWPPNHRMVDIMVSAAAADRCGEATVILASVSSNEPDEVESKKAGATLGSVREAAMGEPDFAFQLRAERAGTGEGRVYSVVCLASDPSGNVRSAHVEASVPHDPHSAR